MEPTEATLNRDDSISSGLANNDSRSGSFEESSTRKVAVSVHDERTLLSSYSLKSTNDFVEIPPGKQDTTTRTGESQSGVVKSTSGDTQASLGVSSSVSGGEPTMTTVLGASTSSLTSITSSATYRQPPRLRRLAGCLDEKDLSTPYNYYRCLSPNEHGTYS